MSAAAVPLPIDWPARTCGRVFTTAVLDSVRYELTCTREPHDDSDCWAEWIEVVGGVVDVETGGRL